ncbi:MaoC family dehydratase [Archangium violaceum]|uniref:Molybdenum cofactor biosynthesis protein MoeC n=1 Tax=Archangium violaceum Cb vi76 TaxID=1406225 RepID=A0A084SY64_9BACT|nr:MaoC family dehydratase [Archangium violaceum]KFA93399.1 molybdenum cofactor biosynthesis protein MoeC [Archangium violaceum Cb vi76]
MDGTGITGYKQVGPQRYREVIGFYFDDFTVGDVFEHRPGRTVTEADNLLFNLLSMNPSPLHIDAAYCEETQWGKPLISSLVTFSIVCGMSVRSTSGRAVANLGWDKIRLTHPVFAGDTLYAESRILAKRLSEKRPGEGIITCETVGLKSTGEKFLSFERSFLVPTREKGVEEKAGY